MKSVGHGLVDHSAVYEPDEDDMAARRQFALEEFERAQRVLVKDIGRGHLGEGVRARGADVVACVSPICKLKLTNVVMSDL